VRTTFGLERVVRADFLRETEVDALPAEPKVPLHQPVALVEILHEDAKGLAGEAAAMEMLKWRDGDFDPVERDWPAKETISAHWQSLLLRAAQVRDESSRSVVVLRPDGTSKVESAALPAIEWAEVTRAMFAGYYGPYAMGKLEDRSFVVVTG